MHKHPIFQISAHSTASASGYDASIARKAGAMATSFGGIAFAGKGSHIWCDIVIISYGDKYNHALMQERKRETSRLLNEDTDYPRSIREHLRQAEQKKQTREQQSKKKSRDSWER